ncbi:hypothetical protein EDC94DRAFT_652747 [Helicostylum pulchrum]|nr:hypothetical protein EDC94DRAFT_652747 [Helicostylum pulchrum]
MSSNESHEEYVKSVERRHFQELTFVNNTAANIFVAANRQATNNSETDNIAPLSDFQNIVVNDGIILDGIDKSVGTIIKQEALRRLGSCKSSSKDMSLVACGMNHIVDLTSGTLTGQKRFFPAGTWKKMKSSFPPPSPVSVNPIEKTRNNLNVKFERALNKNDLEECYWKVKKLQRRAPTTNLKLSYNIISTLIDKVIMHQSIFMLTSPVPSEADIIIKVWADIFEILFYNSGLYLRWGEKVLFADDDNDDDNMKKVFFKLDLKIVVIVDQKEFEVAALEFAPYAGRKKVAGDRSKLLAEAKTIYNSIIRIGIDESDASMLNIVNMQIMGLEGHQIAVRNVANELYVGNSLSSFTLSSVIKDIKNDATELLFFLFQFKSFTLETSEIVKKTLASQKKDKRAMKRKLQEVEESDGSDKLRYNKFRSRLTSTWRHK